MKNKFLCLLCLLLALPFAATAQDFVNLTPKPKQMTVGSGELVLPRTFAVNTANVSEDMAAEVQKFVNAFNAATGYEAVAQNADNALIDVRTADISTVGEEGYKLNVTADGAVIEAATPAGLYFAFQTVKKILPANVMAGVADAAVTKYALPVVSITDQPRFGYRGFMLDVARHFFTVEDVKRMLDVMSYYKMNRFHWHLSDDQGWRVEIKKYPKLTEVGSIAPNSRFTDMKLGQYWINKPYGPYFYTQEQLREVVAYAKERHIEIIPEIDMPGHFVAAMASYPEYSCTPEGTHTIWDDGGISSDVLNVANPAAVQFAKDILTEIMDIFPYDYIHIGGDECPTSAWQNNAECQARYRELGLTSYRQLQSHFIKEVGTHIKDNGRKVIVWNEAISEEGADTKLIQDLDALVFAWTVGTADAGARKAAELGLDNVYTPWGPYYINRKQDPNDPPGAGDGSDNVRATYNRVPVPANISAELAKHYTGVQGTFWTEHVSDRTYMEYLALPRLIAIAEAGWTQQADKNFDDFQVRMTKDSTLLNYNNYNYCRHFYLGSSTGETTKVMPNVSTATRKYYYRLVTRAGSDATRSGSCIELLREGSPLITTYAGKNAQANRLWTAKPVTADDAAYDWQLWSFEEDEANPGHYALVCKAQPEGSVKPDPTATSTAGRWDYDTAAKHYNFVLGDNGYGLADGSYYYSIRSDKTTNLWMNASMGGQGYSVNIYNNPSDGNGGLWSAQSIDGASIVYPEFDYLEEGKTYTFTNSVEGFEGITIADDGKAAHAGQTTDIWGNNVWTVTKSSLNADKSQNVQLTNATTGRSIAAAQGRNGRIGYPVTMGAPAVDITIAPNEETHDFTVSIAGKNLYPVPTTSNNLPGIISSGSSVDNTNALRFVGAAWNIQEVRAVTYVCKDEDGNALGTLVRGVPVGEEDITAVCPEFKNMVKVSAEKADDTTVNVTYKRSAYAVTTVCRDQHGAILFSEEKNCPVGENFTVSLPELDYCTFVSSDHEDGSSFAPEADAVILATYEHDAYNGVKELGQAVSNLESGKSYLIYDNSDADNGGRRGFRSATSSKQINRVAKAEGATPASTWTLEASGSGFKVKNTAWNAYVPLLSTQNTPVTLTDNGGVFTFSKNPDGSWQIKGSNNVCWDGVANGNLVGWNAPGHPYVVYEYVADLYFNVKIQVVDMEDNVLAPETNELVKAGSTYTLTVPAVKDYILKEIQGGGTDLAAVGKNLTVKIIMTVDPSTGITGVESEKATGKIYDLSGRRLNGISGRGVYIIDGQKVMVK